MAPSHWAQLKESGSLRGMRILLFANRYGGSVLFRILLFPVVCFYLVCKRASYRASLDYLQRLHAYDPTQPRPRPWHVFRHFWNFATSLLDKMLVWSGRITRSDVVLHGSELIDTLLAEQRGAMLLISHLGNFEICQALSQGRHNLHLTVLHHTRHATKFNKLLSQQKHSATIKLLQVSDLDVAVAIQLGARISAGEFVASAADRVAISNHASSRLCNFLGQPAPFPTGPFALALALQAPVISVFCLKKNGRYHVHFEQLWSGGEVKRAQRNTRIASLLDAYVAKLEYHCLTAPLQWYNFYSFWSQAPALDNQQDSRGNR